MSATPFTIVVRSTDSDDTWPLVRGTRTPEQVVKVLDRTEQDDSVVVVGVTLESTGSTVHTPAEFRAIVADHVARAAR